MIYSEDIDFNIMTNAINLFIKQNETMRHQITETEYGPKQYIVEYNEQQFELIDFTNSGGLQAIDKWGEEDGQKPFILVDNALFKFYLLKVDDHRQGLYLKIHHLISDAWTMIIIGTEITENYYNLKDGNSNLNRCKKSYTDYILEENRYLASQRFNDDKLFWEKQLSKTLESTPFKQNAVILDSLAAKRKSIQISNDLSTRLFHFCSVNHISMFNFFYCVLAIYLCKIKGTNNVSIGTMIMNRNRDYSSTAGMFVGTLPLPINIDETIDMVNMAQSFYRDWKTTLRHREYPYDLMLADVRENNPSSSMLYDIVLSYQNAKFDVQQNYRATWYFNHYQTDTLVINISDRENSGKLTIDYDYLIELFTDFEIEQMHGHLMTLIQDSIASPQKPLNDLEILTDSEKYQLVYEFNDTYADYPRNKTIHKLFEEQVERTPDNVAVMFEDKTLTYRELNNKANQLARILREKDAGPDKIIGIMVNRSFEMIIGIMGILKAGGAYLPIDPDYPQDRIEFMLQDSGTNLLLTLAIYQDKMNFEGELITIDDAELFFGDSNNLDGINQSTDLAYVIYTSGSTGRPKGVMIEHFSVINRLNWMQKKYPIGVNDTILHKTPYTFDVSVWELFWWGITGARVIMLEPGGEKEPAVIAGTIERDYITTLHFVPSMLNLFLEYLQENPETLRQINLRQVFASGEALTPAQVNKFNRLFSKYTDVTLNNLYGPTEATVDVSYYDCPTDTEVNIVPIGKPIDNIQLYVLDRTQRLAPMGCPGELYISGDGLARGYLNRPELSAEKFVANPFSPGTRMYRTGDLARWLPDGNIEYLGRQDFQVKIRGNRIELGEIEAALLEYKGTKDTVVIALSDHTGDNYLCAYIVLDNDEPAVEEIRAHLSKNLPEFMIPTRFVFLDCMPLSPNGKLDRKALPQPENIHSINIAYVAPRNQTEAIIVSIWEEILGVVRVGIDDDFFNLGGHSLKAIRMVQYLRKRLGIIMPVRSVFRMPTIRRLSESFESVPLEGIMETLIPADKEDFYPVSSAQKRLFILQQIDPQGTAYNIPSLFKIEGKLNVTRLETTIKYLIDRHESLRTSFHVSNGGIVQKVQQQNEFRIERALTDTSDLDKIVDAFVRPFDLEQAPLLRIRLITGLNMEEFLLFDVHHIICDGVSLGILIREIVAIYEGCNLKPLRLQYKDFSVWQPEFLSSNMLKQQEEYWLSVFADEVPVLNIPGDYPRPSTQSFAGNRLTYTIGKDMVTQIYRLSTETGSTIFMIFLAALKTLLYRYTGQTDIVVGTAIAARPSVDLEGIIGMFVNTLVIRSYPEGDKEFLNYLAEIKDLALRAYDNQDFPFEELVEKINVRRDLSRNPLFDVMLVVQNQDIPDFVSEEFRLVPKNIVSRTSKVDIYLEVIERDEELILAWEYSSSIFREETISRFAGQFITLMSDILVHPYKRLSEIEILTELEKKKILHEFNNTMSDYPKDKTINQLFEEQVAVSPDKIAIVFPDRQLSYEELNRKSEQVARMLHTKGVRQNDIVGIILERSPEMIIAIMGIIKAGAASTIIDPKLPLERISFILTDSNSKVFLTQERFQVDFPEADPIIIDTRQLACFETSNLYQGVTPSERFLYAVYTSGSTGTPKGVLMEHRSLVNLLHFQKRHTSLNFSGRVAQFAAMSFDVFYQEVFSTLCGGGTLYIVDEPIKTNPNLFIAFLNQHNIDTLFLPTAYLSFVFGELVDTNNYPESVKDIITAGDRLVISDSLKEILKAKMVRLHNHYGPAETHVVTTYTIFPDGAVQETPPIGKPISNTSILIVDQDKQLVPVGVIGEILITGDCVSWGYLNRPELTKERYIDHPILPDKKIYRTGDLGRWLPDGNIEFMGRTDHQVKIRGFRVELGEIEAHLLKYPGLIEAAVIDRSDTEGNKYLCAYVVGEKCLSAHALRRHLAQTLPDYMIPLHFVQIEQLPLTTNGKLDRKAFPEPKEAAEIGLDYLAPKNEVEETLAKIWADVLKIDRVGIKDNFFDRGGDSLKVLRVMTRLFHLEWKLEAKDFFRYPTIEQLALKIQGNVVDKPNEQPPIVQWIGKEKLDNIYINGESKSIENVLLTGGTGFLGAHLLADLIDSTQATVFCLVRGENQSDAEFRLMARLNEYFPGKYESFLGCRIIVVAGDLRKRNMGLSISQINDLGRVIKTVIHTAALVKFLGNWGDFEQVNVFGTQQIIDFCQNYGIKLNHISTTGISGQYLVKATAWKDEFTENDFYIGQDFMGNVYIRSKFEAENQVFKAIEEGLNATIFRVGMLTGRYGDGNFQTNIEENGLYNRIKSIVGLGAVSSDFMETSVEFTPIDVCSRAILELLQYPALSNKVFHMCNPNVIQLSRIVSILNDRGYLVDVLDQNSFRFHLETAATLEHGQEALVSLIDDFATSTNGNLDYRPPIKIQSKITQEYLRQLSFKWPEIDDEYLVKILSYMEQVGFLRKPSKTSGDPCQPGTFS